MKKLLILAVVSFFCQSAVAAELIWENIGRENVGIKSVLVNRGNPDLIFLGTANSVLKSDDSGKNWRSVLWVRGEGSAVNFLCADPFEQDTIYAATGSGLFRSTDNGENWRRIFRGKDSFEREAGNIAFAGNILYLGTSGGLFITHDRGRAWERGPSVLGKSKIISMAVLRQDPDKIYIASAAGLFKLCVKSAEWQKLLISFSEQGLASGEESAAEQDNGESGSSGLSYLAIEDNGPASLFLAASTGFYKSDDQGKSWGRLTESGLLSKDIKFIHISPARDIYVIAGSGIFIYRDEHWQELSFALTSSQINFLDTNSQGNIYAGCEEGFFIARENNLTSIPTGSRLDMYRINEPSIEGVQRAAIEYAEVGEDKIKQWRKQAANKAWLPVLSFGLDRNVTDLWHWEGGSTTRSNDDLLVRGRDAIEWDVNLRWDLGELIWNDDQTSIDVRSRLVVQLREDILDKVTKLYFARIRLKIELDKLPIEARDDILEKKLKLDELTASLNAMTGGYFSSQIRNKAQN